MSARYLLAHLVEEFVVILGVKPDARTENLAQWSGSSFGGVNIATVTLRWSEARRDRIEMVICWIDCRPSVHIAATTQPMLASRVEAPEILLMGLRRSEVVP